MARSAGLWRRSVG